MLVSKNCCPIKEKKKTRSSRTKTLFFSKTFNKNLTKSFSMMYKGDLSSLNKTYSHLVILPFYKNVISHYFPTKMYWSQETHIPAYFVQCMISLIMCIGIAICTKKLYKDLAYETCDCMCTPSHMPENSKTYYIRPTLERFLLDVRHIKCLNSIDFLILILQKSQGKKMLPSTSLSVSPYQKHKLGMLESSIEITQYFTFFFDVTFFYFNWWTLPRKENGFF